MPSHALRTTVYRRGRPLAEPIQRLEMPPGGRCFRLIASRLRFLSLRPMLSIMPTCRRERASRSSEPLEPSQEGAFSMRLRSPRHRLPAPGPQPQSMKRTGQKPLAASAVLYRQYPHLGRGAPGERWIPVPRSASFFSKGGCQASGRRALTAARATGSTLLARANKVIEEADVRSWRERTSQVPQTNVRYPG